MPEKTRPASLRSKQWEWGLCLVLLAATMLNYANRQVLPISATRMMQELGLSNEEFGRIEAVLVLHSAQVHCWEVVLRTVSRSDGFTLH